eukprot:COSAG02_NODE_37702_length_438_cov_1.365782_1_plen_50_part_10
MVSSFRASTDRGHKAPYALCHYASHPGILVANAQAYIGGSVVLIMISIDL